MLISYQPLIHTHTHTRAQYVHTAIEANNQLEVFKGAVIPMCANCTSDAVVQGLGVVGAVIMPHNLFLHSGLVLVSSVGCEGVEAVRVWRLWRL